MLTASQVIGNSTGLLKLPSRKIGQTELSFAARQKVLKQTTETASGGSDTFTLSPDPEMLLPSQGRKPQSRPTIDGLMSRLTAGVLSSMVVMQEPAALAVAPTTTSVGFQQSMTRARQIGTDMQFLLDKVELYYGKSFLKSPLPQDQLQAIIKPIDEPLQGLWYHGCDDAENKLKSGFSLKDFNDSQEVCNGILLSKDPGMAFDYADKAVALKVNLPGARVAEVADGWGFSDKIIQEKFLPATQMVLKTFPKYQAANPNEKSKMESQLLYNCVREMFLQNGYDAAFVSTPPKGHKWYRKFLVVVNPDAAKMDSVVTKPQAA